MTVTVSGADGEIIEFVVTGRLTEEELASAQQAAADVIRERGRVRILVNTEGFEGWQQGGSWDDFSFQEQFDRYIEKMAFIGDRKWEDMVRLFSNEAFRAFPIEYFDSDDAEQARAWLSS